MRNLSRKKRSLWLAAGLAFVLFLLPGLAAAESNTFIIIDTSKSMKNQDPRALAKLGVLILADLMAEGSNKVAVLPFDETFVLGQAASFEKPVVYDPALGLKHFATNVESVLEYKANYTYFAPPLNTAANWQGFSGPAKQSENRVVFLITDGNPDAVQSDIVAFGPLKRQLQAKKITVRALGLGVPCTVSSSRYCIKGETPALFARLGRQGEFDYVRGKDELLSRLGDVIREEYGLTVFDEKPVSRRVTRSIEVTDQAEKMTLIVYSSRDFVSGRHFKFTAPKGQTPNFTPISDEVAHPDKKGVENYYIGKFISPASGTWKLELKQPHMGALVIIHYNLRVSVHPVDSLAVGGNNRLQIPWNQKLRVFLEPATVVGGQEKPMTAHAAQSYSAMATVSVDDGSGGAATSSTQNLSACHSQTAARCPTLVWIRDRPGRSAFSAKST